MAIQSPQSEAYSSELSSQAEQIAFFRERIVRASLTCILLVCAIALFAGYKEVAAGFGLGAAASLAGFWLSVRQSMSLLVTQNPKRSAAQAFKGFLPRYVLYGAALFAAASWPVLSFPAAVVGVLLSNLMLVLYQPLLSRLPGSSG